MTARPNEVAEPIRYTAGHGLTALLYLRKPATAKRKPTQPPVPATDDPWADAPAGLEAHPELLVNELDYLPAEQRVRMGLPAMPLKEPEATAWALRHGPEASTRAFALLTPEQRQTLGLEMVSDEEVAAEDLR